MQGQWRRVWGGVCAVARTVWTCWAGWELARYLGRPAAGFDDCSVCQGGFVKTSGRGLDTSNCHVQAGELAQWNWPDRSLGTGASIGSHGTRSAADVAGLGTGLTGRCALPT
jgi:hypothetical protein